MKNIPVVRIDLGCGTVKAPGFFGIDRFRLGEVDIVGDLNRPLPITNDSVELILASHCLEHVDNLHAVMKDIYRICKKGAQICIVAPYGQQGLNLANPYHKQVFNEHTARFWTKSQATPIEDLEYQHPQADFWGLAESDNSVAEMDFRCLRMEFFYFPEYRNLSLAEQRAARKKYLDVCDQIMYHLVVVKEPINEETMEEISKNMEYYEPPYISIRKLQERFADQETNLNFLKKKLEEKEKEFSGLRNDLEMRINQLQDALEEKAGEVDWVRRELEGERIEKEALRQEKVSFRQIIDQMKPLQTRIESWRRKGAIIADELDRFRHRKAVRWLNRIHNKYNAWNEIAHPFQQLKDDSLIFTDNLKGFRLQPSVNLQRVSFLSYPLELKRSNLTSILVAPICDLPLSRGEFGIEIVSPLSEIVVQTVVSSKDIDESVPIRFDFEPISGTDSGKFWVRVFARDVDGPVRVFEWQKYTYWGFGKLQTRAFCGFCFEKSR